MSADPIFTIWCDSPECTAWCDGDSPDNTSTARAARSVARRFGWVRRRVNGELLDLCPDHAAAPSPDSEA